MLRETSPKALPGALDDCEIGRVLLVVVESLRVILNLVVRALGQKPLSLNGEKSGDGERKESEGGT